MNRYVASSLLPAPQGLAFDYHNRTGALDRLIPPWKNVSVVSSDHSLEPGSVVALRVAAGPIKLRWIAEHTQYDPPHRFADVQRSGPFSHWEHLHEFEAVSENDSTIRDTVDYELPLGPLGRWLGGRRAARELETMFAYRHRVTQDDLQLITRWPQEPLTIAISGATGLVGRKLGAFLKLAGHRVIRLVRSTDGLPSSSNPSDDVDEAIAPWSGEQEAAKLSGVDAVVHLAGKSIADARWNQTVKQQIRDSRVDLTYELSRRLAALPQPPRVLVCASATGIYGDRGDEELDERSEGGEGFLAEVAAEWEQACEPARQAGIRVANARLGVVLDPSGGALPKMLTPAKFFGGALGNGRQWWSWIAIDDVIGSIYHAIACDQVRGVFNVVSPEPVTCGQFADRVARTVSRRAVFPAPAFLLRLALGEMADPLLLASTKVRPSVLEETGYVFRFRELDQTLRYCLGKDRLESEA